MKQKVYSSVIRNRFYQSRHGINENFQIQDFNSAILHRVSVVCIFITRYNDYIGVVGMGRNEKKS